MKALPKVKMVEKMKAIMSSSPKLKAMAMQIAMKKASTNNSEPIIFDMSFQLTIAKAS